MRRARPVPVAALFVVLSLTLFACDEGETTDPDLARGYIQGTVSVDGDPVGDITVTLSSGEVTATNFPGYYVFQDVEAGAYTVTISSFPGNVTFPSTTRAAVLTNEGQVVQVDFDGAALGD